MDDATQKLVDEARRAQKAVYLATDKAVADDLSRIIAGLADALEAAQRPPVSPEVEELLLELRALGADVPERLRQATLLAQAGVPTEALEAFVRGYVSGVPSPPVYDEEKIARFTADALREDGEGFGSCDFPRDFAAALVAALRGGELTREETNE